MAERSSVQVNLEEMIKEIVYLESDNNKLVQRIAELRHRIECLKHEKQFIQQEIEENQRKLDGKPGNLGAKRTTTTTPTGSIYAEPQSEEENFDPDSEL